MRTVSVVLLTLACSTSTLAQSAFTVEQVLSHPFPADLVAAPAGSRIAWTMFERGHRNIYAADGPDFRPRRLTRYDADEGQELTHLSFSDDGAYLVYVRGGDHGSNWDAEGNLQPNPTSSPVQPKMQVWSIAATGGDPVLLGDGDAPVIAPRTKQVAFVKDRRIWLAPIDGSTPAAQLFFARGEIESPVWSPDGSMLAFVSNRETHSYIGIYRSEREPIQYLAPTTSRDTVPRWSPDGKRIAFVRQPGRGGPIPDPLVLQPQPWSVWVADVNTGTARETWKSGSALVDSIPRTLGGPNLHWAAGDRLVFLSYADGWPHLYSVPASGGRATLLTAGAFMVEYVAMSPDRRTIFYNANSGSDSNDVDRRHLFRVAVDAPGPTQLTSGSGIEWNPVVTGDGRTVAYLSSTVQRPGLPTVMPAAGGAPRLLAVDRIPTDFPSSQLVTPENVIVRAPDGAEVHCQLFMPPAGSAQPSAARDDGPHESRGARAAGANVRASVSRPPNATTKRAAIVFVHGGPPRQMLLGWHYMFYYANTYALNQYLASRGFVVLSVNYRLGIGYGHAFHYPESAGVRGASEYQDVLAAGRYLQTRDDIDPARIGIWGGSYGGYLAALALGRNSDVFAAGVDIHGVHLRNPGISVEDAPQALKDGLGEDLLERMRTVAWQSSPVSAVAAWKSPVLLIHGDDDRNVRFEQTVDLLVRLRANGVEVEELVIPDDIHDFLLFRNWVKVGQATGDYFERKFRAAPTSSR
jgi:dipeptidyl aminopeptidase/acylaminoacyl peptidase